MNIFGHLHELQTYQQFKMAAILIAILNFVHFLVLEIVDNHFNIFLYHETYSGKVYRI